MPPIDEPVVQRDDTSGVSENFVDEVRQLERMSADNFVSIRTDSAMNEDGDGDRSYIVHDFNACGDKVDYNKVWHWRSFKGNWEYVCDVDLTDREAADAYYDEMVRRMHTMKDFTWEPEARVNQETVRRVIGRKSNPPIKIMFDFDIEDNGNRFEIEFWFKQKNNPGAQTQKGGQPIGPTTPTINTSPTKTARVSPTLAKQVKQLLRWSKNDFKDLRIDSTMKEDGDGDRNYKAQAGFKACGPDSTYNKVWHWRSMKGNWEYVCDVTLNSEDAANAYYDEMVAQLRRIKDYKWEAEFKEDGTTIRRVIGRKANPPLKLVLDMDREGDGSFEVEFWFKQKNNPGPAARGGISVRGGTVTPPTSSPGEGHVDGDEAAGSKAVSRSLKAQVAKLTRWAKNNFKAIRTGSPSDQGGDSKYDVIMGFNACGPKSGYNRIWHWKSIDNNWEYVCDTDFANHRAAAGYCDKMSAILTKLKGFRWDKEKWVSSTTRRRLEGYNDKARLKIMFDYDASSDGTVEIEFWFKQTYDK